jgi:hypothetical protein
MKTIFSGRPVPGICTVPNEDRFSARAISSGFPTKTLLNMLIICKNISQEVTRLQQNWL